MWTQPPLETLFVLSTVFIALAKQPTKTSQKGLILATAWGCCSPQRRRHATGVCSHSCPQNRERNAGAQFTFSLLFILKSQPTEWCHPYLGWCFCPSANTIWNSLTYTLRGLSSVGSVNHHTTQIQIIAHTEIMWEDKGFRGWLQLRSFQRRNYLKLSLM